MRDRDPLNRSDHLLQVIFTVIKGNDLREVVK